MNSPAHSFEHPNSSHEEKKRTYAAPSLIAVSGKGGTGKTTFCSILIRELAGRGLGPVLAVDADPNANLHEALGLELTETLGSMREEVFSRQIPAGMGRSEYLSFRFHKVLVEGEGVDLVAMGRPEGHGCYCFANDVLRECLQLQTEQYRFVVIDTEAGMEHISRGTVGHPDLLLILSDPGARGLRTVARIRSTALHLGFRSDRILTIVNRVRSGMANIGTGEPFGIIPFDPEVESADLRGTPVSRIPPESPFAVAVRGIAGKIIELTRREPK